MKMSVAGCLLRYSHLFQAQLKCQLIEETSQISSTEINQLLPFAPFTLSPWINASFCLKSEIFEIFFLFLTDEHKDFRKYSSLTHLCIWDPSGS